MRALKASFNCAAFTSNLARVKRYAPNSKVMYQQMCRQNQIKLPYANLKSSLDKVINRTIFGERVFFCQWVVGHPNDIVKLQTDLRAPGA